MTEVELLKEFGLTAASANATASDALAVAREAVALAQQGRDDARRLALYFEQMAATSGAGNTGAAGAFLHAAELVAMLARGEKIL